MRIVDEERAKEIMEKGTYNQTSSGVQFNNRGSYGTPPGDREEWYPLIKHSNWYWVWIALKESFKRRRE